MNWPFWRRSKSNPVAAVTFAGMGLSEAAFGRLAHARQNVRDGFNANVTAFVAVTQIAQADAGIPWVLMRRGRTTTSKTIRLVTFRTAAKVTGRGTSGRKSVANAVIEDHPLLELLEKPNPLQGGEELQEMRIAHQLVNGNSYTITAGPSNGPPRELWTLRPDRVKVVPDPVEWVKGYAYEVGGYAQTFAASRVLHRKLVSMDDDYYGMSPLRVAMRNVMMNNEAVRWNYALLKNSARPPGMFVSKSSAGLTDVQYNRLKASVDTEYSGADNAGRPMLGEGDLEWKSMGFSPADVDWLAGLKDARRQIASAFNVAPELLGDGENKTFANFAEARKALYLENVLPGKDRDRGALNNWLVPMFNEEGLYLDYDRDCIEALEEDREKLWGRVEQASSLSINEKRRMLGFGDIPAERGGNLVLVSAAMTPVDITVASENDNA